MVKWKINWEIYLISGLITIIILLAGIFFGVYLSEKKVSTYAEALEELKIEHEDLQLSLIILPLYGNKTCAVLEKEFNSIQVKTAKLGGEIIKYETGEVYNTPYFETIKKEYALTSVRYWLYARKMNQECNASFVPILYFYSNVHCPDCPKQGLILSSLKQSYPQNAMIFALDYDLDLNTINSIKLAYEVEKVPTLIINDEKYAGLVTLDQLKQCLRKS